MASAFSITTATNSVQVETGHPAAVVFTVANSTGQAVVGRASLAAVPPHAEHSKWLRLRPPELSERRFAIGGVENYTVEAASIPASAPAGEYTFRLDMVATHNPDETYTAGPTVVLNLAREKPAPRPFPWWILLVALLVLGLVGGVLVWAFSSGSPELAASLEPESSGVVAGSEVSYLLTLTNTGKRAEQVLFSLELPAGGVLIFSDQDPGCSISSSEVICEFEQLEKDGDIQLPFLVAVDGGHRGELVVRAEVSAANTRENEPVEVISRVAVQVETAPEIQLLAPESVFVGDELPIQATISNSGRSHLTGVRVRYAIPPGVQVLEVSADCQIASQEVVCQAEQLPSDRSLSINLVLAPEPAAVGQLVTRLEVSSNEGAFDRQASTTVNRNVGLSLSINQPEREDRFILVGSPVLFRLRVSNNTADPADNVTLRYSLPQGTEFDPDRQNRIVDVRSCVNEEANREVVCSVGTLPASQGATIEIYVVHSSTEVREHTFTVSSPAFAEAQDSFGVQVIGRTVCPSGCPFTKVQDAVNAAEPGAVIGIGPGEYKENLSIPRNVTLVGDHNNGSILDGSQAGRVIDIAAGMEVRLYQLIVQNGKAPNGSSGGDGGSGGGIRNAGRLLLVDVILGGNAAGQGGEGAVRSRGGNGGNGGAIFNSGELQLVNVKIEKNAAGYGGRGGSSSPGGNGGDGGDGGDGGGIYSTGTLAFENVTFVDNQAGSGGSGGNAAASGTLPGRGGRGRSNPDYFSLGSLTQAGSNTFSGGKVGSDGSGGCSFGTICIFDWIITQPVFQIEPPLWLVVPTP
jgi:hypothetical protein